MGKERLTAFSNGVLAVIITIMVLDLRAPHDVTLPALLHLAPGFLGYVLSFVYVGIYWNNHHHFFQLVERVDGAVLCANLRLLFWLSLIPFATGWLGTHPLAPGADGNLRGHAADAGTGLVGDAGDDHPLAAA